MYRLEQDLHAEFDTIDSEGNRRGLRKESERRKKKVKSKSETHESLYRGQHYRQSNPCSPDQSHKS